MTCPRCLTEFESDPGRCPECGVVVHRNISGVMKTSAVMIAAANGQGFYRSVQDVPEPLRSQLWEVTSSPNSGTIVIADRAGKEQLTQVVGRRESAARSRAVTVTTPAVRRSQFLGLSWIVWAGVLLLLFAGGIVTAVFTIH